MGTRALLSGVPTAEVNMDRYDELLHKEQLLNDLIRLHQSEYWKAYDSLMTQFEEEMGENND